MHKILVTVVILFVATGISFTVKAQQTLNEKKPEFTFYKAIELIEQKHYQSGRALMREYLQKPDATQKQMANYYLLVASIKLGNEDAERLGLSYLDKYPNHKTSSEVCLLLADKHFENRGYRNAVKYYDLAQQTDPELQLTDQKKFRIGYSYFTLREFEQAPAYFEPLTGGTGNFAPDASYYLAYIENNKGNFKKALGLLNTAARSDNYSHLVPTMKVKIYYNLKQFSEVIDLAKPLLENPKADKELFLISAEANYNLGKHEQAAKFYEKAGTNLKPESRVRYGYALYNIKNYQSAINQLENNTITADSLKQIASYYLGLAYLKQNNKTFAFNAFNSAINTGNNKEIIEEALFKTGVIKYEQSQFTEAINIFKSYKTQYTNSNYGQQADELLSDAFLKTNNYDDAISYIEQLPTLSYPIKKAYQRVTYQKAVTLFNKGQLEPAADYFNRALKYPIDNNLVIGSHYWIGETYSAAELWPEAEKAYRTVISVSSPENHLYNKARYGLGYALYNTKQFESALLQFKYYTVAFENNQATSHFYKDGLLRLSDCYYVTKDYNKALKNYDKLIDLRIADRDYAYYQKGMVLSFMNRPTEAKAAFNIILNEFSNSRYSDEALYQKSRFDFEEGTYATAINGFTELIQKHPTSGLVPFSYIKRAVAYGNIGKPESAINDYVYVIENFTRHKAANNALLGLQENLSMLNRSEEFNKYLEFYKKMNPEKTDVEHLEFENAKQLYFSQKYQKAIDGLRNFLVTYKESSFDNEAKYYLGESHYRNNDYEEALGYYDQVIQNGNGQLVSRSVKRKGEIYLLQGAYEKSITANQQLASIAVSKKDLAQAYSGLIEAYYEINNLDSAQIYVEKILKSGNSTLDAENKAALFDGKIAYKQGKLNEAVDAFLNTLNTAKDQYGAEAQFLMAEIQFKQGNHKQSLETLFDLVKNFSTYPTWYDKAFLLIAQNYDALGNTYNAIASLESTIENSPRKATRQKAQDLLDQIQEKENAKKDSLEAAQDTLLFTE